MKKHATFWVVLALLLVSGIAAKQTVNIGSSANDGTGDTLRNAFDKLNDNFLEVPFTVDTVADLVALVPSANYANVYVRGYYSIGDGGGGMFTPTNSVTSTNLGTRIVSTTSGWSWERIVNDGVYNVKHFGAKADDGTDDSASIQSAIDKAESVVGGKVLFHTGVFDVSSALTITTNVIVVGSGFDSTQIKLASSSNTNLVEISGGDVFVSGIKFDGNQANQSYGTHAAIYYNGTSGGNLVVRDCWFYETKWAGIGIAGDVDSVDVQHCKFTDMAEHTGTAGQITAAMHCSGSTATRYVFSGNYVKQEKAIAVAERAPGGIIISQTADFSLHATDNYFENIGQNAAANKIGNIDIYNGGKNIVIADNAFKNYYYNAIKAQNCLNAAITGNVIDGEANGSSSSHGIGFEHARNYTNDMVNCTISGNVVSLTGRAVNGIFVDGDDEDTADENQTFDVIISGNVVKKGARGIFTRYTSRVTLSDNIVQDCEDGVWLRDVTTNAPVLLSITGGIISGSTDNAIEINNTGTNIVSGSVAKISNVMFSGNTEKHIQAKFIENLLVNGCFFYDDPNTLALDIDDVTMLVVDSNKARTGVSPTVSAVNVDTYWQFNNQWDAKHTLPQNISALNVGASDATSQLDIDFPNVTSASGSVRLFRLMQGDTGDLRIFRGNGSTDVQSIFRSYGNSAVNVQAGNFGIGNANPTRKLDITGEVGISSYIEGTEIADPSAPAANNARIYVRDNGSGKSQLVVRFPTGAIQVIATEP